MTIRIGALCACVLVAACNVESSRPPLTPGAGLAIDDASGKITLDQTKVPLETGDCAKGSVLQKGDSGWTCAAVATLESEPSKAADQCASGQVVVKTDAGYACAPNTDPASTPVVVACEDGKFVQKTSSGWVCAAPLDPASTPTITNCAPNSYVHRGAAGWECTGLAGDMTGTFSGPLAGDVTGNVTGSLTGPVTGNVTGDLMGNVTGDVHGNLFGNVTGNVTGNVAGNVTGDVTGNLHGNLTGNVTGNVTGNLTGNVTGNLTGNVTGNVSGTAGGLSVILPIANGGTGASTLTGNTLLLANAGGTAMTGLLPGSAGNVLVSNGTQWTSTGFFNAGVAGRTKGATNYYARVDGDDTLCNGLADAAASAAPACAKQSFAAVIALAPEVVTDDVTVNFGAGTFYVQSIQLFHRNTSFNNAILWQGVAGQTFLDGARSSTPNTATTSFGIRIQNTKLTMNGLSWRNFKQVAIGVQEHSTVLLNDTNSFGNGTNLQCETDSICNLTTTQSSTVLNFKGAAGSGNGLNVQTRAQLQTFSNIDLTDNAAGLTVQDARFVASQGTTITANNNGTAITGGQLAYVNINAIMNATNCSSVCISAADNAVVNIGFGGAFSSATRDFLVQTGAYLRLFASNNSQGADLNLDCTGSTGRIGTSNNRGQLYLQGDSAANIKSTNTCQKGIDMNDGSYMFNGGPTRAITLTGSGEKPVNANSASVVQRGPFVTGDVVCASTGTCY